jgi:hypothetical protein
VEITGCNEEMFSQVDCGKGEALPVFGKERGFVRLSSHP